MFLGQRAEHRVPGRPRPRPSVCVSSNGRDRREREWFIVASVASSFAIDLPHWTDDDDLQHGGRGLPANKHGGREGGGVDWT